jgi:hypothetical protein
MRYRVLHVAAVTVHRGRDLIMRLDNLALGERTGHSLCASRRCLPIVLLVGPCSGSFNVADIRPRLRQAFLLPDAGGQT